MLMYVKMDVEHFKTLQLMTVNTIHRTSMNTKERDGNSQCTSDDNKVIAGKCGAIEAIVSTMKTHIDNADVCRYGCGTLQNIATIGKYYHLQN